MLTFEQKLEIIESFPELTRKNVSLGRVNFHYEESAYEKVNVVYHLHPNGNGFVFAEYISGCKTDPKGMVNIRDFSEEELRSIIQQSILSLSVKSPAEEAIIDDGQEEHWVNSENQSLMVIHEDDMWNVYAGLNLDGTFLSYNEAREYLEEEGFKKR